jgi:hypothetical protein
MKGDPNRVLVEGVQRGNTWAFGRLVWKCQKRIYELAYCFTRQPEDAYDLS